MARIVAIMLFLCKFFFLLLRTVHPGLRICYSADSWSRPRLAGLDSGTWSRCCLNWRRLLSEVWVVC